MEKLLLDTYMKTNEEEGSNKQLLIKIYEDWKIHMQTNKAEGCKW